MRRLLLSFFLFVAIGTRLVQATTTSGTTTRLVNISDGVIATGAAAGSNTAAGSWESDEEFQGFQGAVNWYLTWDDNNLYLGRLNGNNAEGSLIYLRADGNGLSFSNNTQTYDGFSPQFNNLSGINFVAYIKNTYDEFRTFSSGAWSGPNTSLSPSFGTTSVNGVNQSSMEVAIPWNNITNGNGRPDNLRAVFFQVVPNNLFVYGESPYGTGIGGNGPAVGVNDGASTSAAQPGGNVSSNPVITRWWGCYPVIGGVGANGFVAVQPNAGTDQELCSPQSSVTLNGNAPAALAAGTWALASAPAGAPAPVIVSPNQPSTQVSGLTANGVYKFVWNINYGRCPAVPDTVIITRLQTPANAAAGSDTLLPCGITSLNLTGNDPGPLQNFTGGTVEWQVVQGNASIVSPFSATTLVNNLGVGNTRLSYRIQNGSCVSQPDEIVITRFAPASASAGNNANICGNSFTLSGNNPATLQAGASGLWTQVSGPSTAVFTNQTQYNATANGLQQGTYVFQWKVSNGNCPPDSATVSVQVGTPVPAAAGSNISLCGQTTVALLANNPAPGTGTWTQISGPNQAVFSALTSNNPTLTQLQAGTYTFQWKVSTPGCPSDSDRVNVTIFRDPRPFASSNEKNICGTSATVSAVNPLSIDLTATGKWKTVSAPGTVSFSSLTSPTVTVSGMNAFGEYVLAYVLRNGNCDSAECRITIRKSRRSALALAGLVQPEMNESNGQIEVYPPAGAALPVIYQINYNTNPGVIFDSLAMGTYYISARDANGCVSDTLVELENRMFVPTGISPNGDNINDTWEIPGLSSYSDCKVTVYNLWGAVVFSSTGYKDPWDGTLDGKKLPSANYYYTIELGKSSEPLRGKITLAR